MSRLIAEYYSCGKLLITGEYLILRGARGLALPTFRGQKMRVSQGKGDLLHWTSCAEDGKTWFEAEFTLDELNPVTSTNSKIAQNLSTVLKVTRELNPDFLSDREGVAVMTTLEFPRDWGLGSSSTLMHNIAQWAQVDGYELLQRTMGGSGYDVKVAEVASPMIFNRSSLEVNATKVEFAPSFRDRIWFVHRGMKQDSAQEVNRFADLSVSDRDLDQVSRITDEVVEAHDLESFERLLKTHDLLISRILARPTAAEEFPGFKGFVKYLGAWGGDFMLATGSSSDMDYFKEKGMNTVLSYREMIKQ